MRQSWTDDRLDDLIVRVERGFGEVDKKLDKINARFERIDEKFERVNERFDSLHRLVVQVVIGLAAMFVAGFGSVLGLIAATQL